ncbi:hypothetical protein GCM10022240_31320 [Microbacterium kribbense]|uniref:SsuA/THI5-like domain-containing protein n=1 Tax=Microbacterium kribbense TaxID=433645 RepID=A0ABP7GXR9_9MICO
MTLRISYFVPSAPLLAARERGLLDGIDLIEMRTPGSPAQLAGLATGELDLVVTAIDNLFEWTAAGADVRLVAQVEHTTPLGIYADPAIATLADLDRRRFAVDAFANGFALVARHLLGGAGIEPDYIEVGGVRERLDALVAGIADATLLGPPFDGQALAAGMHELLRVGDLLPAFPGQGLVVRAALLGSPELDLLLAGLRSAGLLPVDPAGLDLLTDIRRELGLLPADVALSALLSTR